MVHDNPENGARYFKKSGGLLRKGKRMRYPFICEHEKDWSITVMCRILEVRPSGYYKWRNAPQLSREQRDEPMRPLIRQAFERSYGTYGSPRIFRELRAQGHVVSKKQIERLMAEMEISAHRPKRFVSTTDSNHDNPIAPNLLEQNFYAAGINLKWVGDITYIATEEGWLYFATVIDLCSRKLVGWSFSDSLATPLISDALSMAVNQRDIEEGLIFHSDRGCQYTSDEYRTQLHAHKITPSNSRKGCCYDNAVAESFFHSLKTEWVCGKIYATRKEAQISIFRYIESFYNRTRRHSTIDYLSPDDFEVQLAAQKDAA